MTQNQGIRTQDQRVAKDECRTAGQGPEVLSCLRAHFAVNVLFGHGSTDRPPNELWIGQPLRISWEWSRRPESILTDGRPCRHHRACVSYVTCLVKNSEQCAIVLHQQFFSGTSSQCKGTPLLHSAVSVQCVHFTHLHPHSRQFPCGRNSIWSPLRQPQLHHTSHPTGCCRTRSLDTKRSSDRNLCVQRCPWETDESSCCGSF